SISMWSTLPPEAACSASQRNASRGTPNRRPSAWRTARPTSVGLRFKYVAAAATAARARPIAAGYPRRRSGVPAQISKGSRGEAAPRSGLPPLGGDAPLTRPGHRAIPRAVSPLDNLSEFLNEEAHGGA